MDNEEDGRRNESSWRDVGSDDLGSGVSAYYFWDSETRKIEIEVRYLARQNQGLVYGSSFNVEAGDVQYRFIRCLKSALGSFRALGSTRFDFPELLHLGEDFDFAKMSIDLGAKVA